MKLHHPSPGPRLPDIEGVPIRLLAYKAIGRSQDRQAEGTVSTIAGAWRYRVSLATPTGLRLYGGLPFSPGRSLTLILHGSSSLMLRGTLPLLVCHRPFAESEALGLAGRRL